MFSRTTSMTVEKTATADRSPGRILTPVEKRLPARDQLSAGTYIGVELGPLVVPARDVVVRRVRALLELGPDACAGRTIEGDRWRFDPSELDARAEDIVRALPASLTGTHLLPRLREAIDPRSPFTVFLGEDRVAVCIDHRLGDGFLSLMLVAAVLAPRDIPRVFEVADGRDPLPAALFETFARHPGRVAGMLRDKITDPTPRSAVVPTAPAERGSLDLATAVMEPANFRALAAWSKGRVPPTVATTFALQAALRAEGLDVLDAGAILVDLRRYLPSGVSTLANFVVGHPLDLTQGIDAVGARFTRDLRTARPLAAHVAGRRSAARRAANPAKVPAGAFPIVSDMGFLRALEPLPWASETPTVNVSVDPASRNGITALTSVLRRRFGVSLSFDSTLHDRDRVQAACERLCRDPLELLPS